MTRVTTCMDSSLRYFWEDLLQFIGDKSVIPIIGPELLEVEVEGERAPLYRVVARKLAASLGVSPESLAEGFSINEVACAFLKTAGARREDIYRRLRSILKELTPALPAALVKLASITHFKLFVTITFDTLLEDAVNQARFDGRPETLPLVYTLNQSGDLPAPMADMVKPAVFYLFGRASGLPNYVATDEDVLEFLHSLQSETRRPTLLFDELRTNHLLFIGCGHSDWLSRFFIRTIRNERLTNARDKETVVAGDNVCKDTSLTVFLTSPLSYGTKVIDFCGAAAFVDELHDRWLKEYPPSAAPLPSAAPPPPAEPPMEPGAVFLSYASEDLEIVARARDALEQAGIDVWFDKRRLEFGDDYDRKIALNIRKCSLFCPFISANTENRLEGYFRREWFYATERAKSMDPSRAFILPVFLGDTSINCERIPEAFERKHSTRMSGDALPQDFVDKVRNMVRAFHKREQAS